MEGYQCENAHDKGWRYEVAYSTALRPKVHLAGRSGHEAQDQRRRWGEVPKSGKGHPPVLPVDFAPSLNWAGSNAHARTPRFLSIHRAANKTWQPSNSSGVDDVTHYTHATNRSP